MNNIPNILFVSHFSLKSVLTLKEFGKSKHGGPDSIIDIAKELDIEHPILVDSTLSGFIDFYKNSVAAKLSPIFGYKLTVCSDLNDKTDESKLTESKIIIFIKNGKSGIGYYDLIKIHNLATTVGFFGVPRIDWKHLKKLFTKNLHIAIPFYDNAWHLNNLHGYNAIPNFSFTEPTVFLESNDLPFDHLIENSLSTINKNWNCEKAQTVRYKSEEDFINYLTYLCIQNRSNLAKPQINHLGSKTFNVMRHFK